MGLCEEKNGCGIECSTPSPDERNEIQGNCKNRQGYHCSRRDSTPRTSYEAAGDECPTHVPHESTAATTDTHGHNVLFENFFFRLFIHFSSSYSSDVTHWKSNHLTFGNGKTVRKKEKTSFTSACFSLQTFAFTDDWNVNAISIV